MYRFAAKLLFQFRMAQGKRSNQRRICEERIVIIESRSAEVAYGARSPSASRASCITTRRRKPRCTSSSSGFRTC
jgi:hypothetical protein